MKLECIGVERFGNLNLELYNASFYENIELLLKDISVEIKDWIEVK